jgi:hypothetical protein
MIKPYSNAGKLIRLLDLSSQVRRHTDRGGLVAGTVECYWTRHGKEFKFIVVVPLKSARHAEDVITTKSWPYPSFNATQKSAVFTWTEPDR